MPQRFNPDSWRLDFLNRLTEEEGGGGERMPEEGKLDIYGMSYEGLPGEGHAILIVRV